MAPLPTGAIWAFTPESRRGFTTYTITLQISGTVQAWNEMKAQSCETHEVYEFAHAVERGLGIGLIVNPSASRIVRRPI
jgi:hypothetical protein